MQAALNSSTLDHGVSSFFAFPKIDFSEDGNFRKLTRCLSSSRRKVFQQALTNATLEHDITIDRLRDTPINLVADRLLFDSIDHVADIAFFSSLLRFDQNKLRNKKPILTNLRDLNQRGITFEAIMAPYFEISKRLAGDQKTLDEIRELMCESNSMILLGRLSGEFSSIFNLGKGSLIPNFRILKKIAHSSGVELVPTLGMSSRRDLYRLFLKKQRPFFLELNDCLPEFKTHIQAIDVDGVSINSYDASAHDFDHAFDSGNISKASHDAYRVAVMAAQKFLLKIDNSFELVFKIRSDGELKRVKFPSIGPFNMIKEEDLMIKIFDFSNCSPEESTVFHYPFAETLDEPHTVINCIRNLKHNNTERKERLADLFIDAGLYLQRELCYAGNEEYFTYYLGTHDDPNVTAYEKVLKDVIEKTGFEAYVNSAKIRFERLQRIKDRR